MYVYVPSSSLDVTKAARIAFKIIAVFPAECSHIVKSEPEAATAAVAAAAATAAQ